MQTLTHEMGVFCVSPHPPPLFHTLTAGERAHIYTSVRWKLKNRPWSILLYMTRSLF
jgi:hypothetical protein